MGWEDGGEDNRNIIEFMRDKKRIIFILGSISQPRVIKRIKSFVDNGFEVKVYGFNRNKYNVNAKIEGVNINIVGELKDGEGYITKLKEISSLYLRLRKKYNKPTDFFYLFGYVEALTTLFFPSNYIYEISDILYGYKKFEPVEWLFRWIDKKLVKRSKLTVMTSGGFEDYLFNGEKQKNIVLQPNKLHSYFENENRDDIKFQTTNKNINFSFIGAFRYPNTVFRFAHVVGKYFPEHKFKFYGDSSMTEQVKDISNLYDNVEYYGAYKNPDDLKSIYNQVDFVVACYDPEGMNERIAEPNKMYEAIYFKKPIVVSAGTYLAKQVDKYGCGFAIDATSDENIINFINSITNDSLQKINENIEKIESKDIIDDNAEKIIDILLNMYSSN